MIKLSIPPPLIWLICALLIYQFRTEVSFEIYSIRVLFSLLILILSAIIALFSLLPFYQTRTTLDPRNPQKTTTLIQHGSFRFSRNPMYLSLALSLLALSSYSKSAVGFLIIFGFILYITYFQIMPEEKILTKKFGKQYRDYCKNVRRWI